MPPDQLPPPPSHDPHTAAAPLPRPVQQPYPGAQTGQAGTPQPASGPDQDYGFILNPPKPAAKRLLAVPQASSLAAKLILGSAGLFVLLLLFVIIRGILGGDDFNVPALLSVAQDQQELIHLTAKISQDQGIATSTINSTATIQLSVTMAQNNLLGYLKDNGQKVKPKQLNLKVSAATDTQLSTALSNGTYDATYQSVMQEQLNTYLQDLHFAYEGDRGSKGRALLTADYNAAQLLVQQLTSPAS